MPSSTGTAQISRKAVSSVGNSAGPKPVEIGIPGGAVRLVEPESEQQHALEQELLAVARDAQAVQQALQCETREHQPELHLLGLGAVQQAGPHRRAEIGFRGQSTLSRYARAGKRGARSDE